MVRLPYNTRVKKCLEDIVVHAWMLPVELLKLFINIQATFIFTPNEELRNAVSQYLRDTSKASSLVPIRLWDAVTKYLRRDKSLALSSVPIGLWDVSQITNFQDIFYAY